MSPTAAGAEPDVLVRALVKDYGPARAVHGVDLEIHRGEVFALLGPNGAGKTTTLEILTGARRRTSGDVRVLGRDPADDARDWRARIGVVPQSTGAFDDLTVREVVEHFAAFYPAPLPSAEVIDMVGLGEKSRKPAGTLSGGQRRRLDVAVGVIGDPELIFLDEPTTGLDPMARREAWDLVRHFAERGATTLLTTHYLDEAEELAARAAVIAEGRVLECAPIAELGGRADAPATVTFTRRGPLAGVPLPDLPDGCTARQDRGTWDGGTVEITTAEPSRLLSLLLPWVWSTGLSEAPDLRVHRPTLEEVYLAMIGEAGREQRSAGADGPRRAAA